MNNSEQPLFRGYINYYLKGVLKTWYFRHKTRQEVAEKIKQFITHSDQYVGYISNFENENKK